MIKTKYSLVIFTILFIILIPYTAIFSQLDFISSIIPGWHTTINSFHLIANILKLFILFIILVMYWKLSKREIKMSKKLFSLHLILTVPSIFISKIPLLFFVNYDSNNLEKTIVQIETMNKIVIVLNSLFIVGQILFGIYYWKTSKENLQTK